MNEERKEAEDEKKKHKTDRTVNNGRRTEGQGGREMSVEDLFIRGGRRDNERLKSEVKVIN